MKIFKEIQVSHQDLIAIICDKCKIEYEDVFELGEFHNISFTAGYGSIIGDGNIVECDLCQHCLKELIGPYLRITYTDYS